MQLAGGLSVLRLMGSRVVPSDSIQGSLGVSPHPK